MHARGIRLQERGRTCAAQDARFFALLCAFVAALLPWAAPENRTWMHKSWKNFDGPRSPLPEGECAAFNARLHGKHGDQAAHLLCVSVDRRTFLWREHAHRPVGGAKSKGKGAPPTNGGGCRPGGEAGCQFRQQPIKDARFSFRPLTALGQYFHFFSSLFTANFTPFLHSEQKKKIALRDECQDVLQHYLLRPRSHVLIWNTCPKLKHVNEALSCPSLPFFARPHVATGKSGNIIAWWLSQFQF